MTPGDRQVDEIGAEGEALLLRTVLWNLVKYVVGAPFRLLRRLVGGA